jgi:hypothetical protein
VSGNQFLKRGNRTNRKTGEEFNNLVSDSLIKDEPDLVVVDVDLLLSSLVATKSVLQSWNKSSCLTRERTSEELVSNGVNCWDTPRWPTLAEAAYEELAKLSTPPTPAQGPRGPRWGG